MRIKLRNLIYLTEQAPQPVMANSAGGMGGSPLPAPVAPPTGMNAGGEETPTATPDASTPTPEDPGEYDFTKDFREFEDKKNKAESEAKKILLDKMNEKLLNKTIVANASRGYGQPKTDYTIEGIKKVSVEFWYKDYVVIATDKNDKKYFLTPGINIKIESGASEPAPGGEEQKPETSPTAEVPPQEEPETKAPPTTGQEVPNAPNAETPEIPPQGQPQSPNAEKPELATPPPQTPEPPQQEIPRKKKKKVIPPVTEFIQRDLNKFLLEFMTEKARINERGNVDFISYIDGQPQILTEGKNITKTKCKLLIPENHMKSPLDIREVRLSAMDTLRHNTPYGSYSKGSVDIVRNGRYYILEYIKETGWNI